MKLSVTTAVAFCFAAAPLSQGFSTPALSLLKEVPRRGRGTVTSRAPFILTMSEEDSPPSDAEESPATPSTAAITQTVKEHGVSAVKSLFQKIDDGGQQLKPMAMTAKEKADSDSRKTNVLYTIKSCILFSLFIVYRAYRGFFVILPAVFREVYRKLEDAVESPFVDDEAVVQGVNPKTGKVRKRFAVTTSFLAFLVTVSYAVTGAFRVVGKFFKTIFSSHKATTSFEAAADEIVVNEDKIIRMTKHDKDVNDGKVNGEDLTNLAP